MCVEHLPVSVEKLAIVSLAVEDQVQAREWYEETLGVVVRADAPSEMNGRTGRWLTASPAHNEKIEIALLEPDENSYEERTRTRIEEMRGTDPMWTIPTARLV